MIKFHPISMLLSPSWSEVMNASNKRQIDKKMRRNIFARRCGVYLKEACIRVITIYVSEMPSRKTVLIY